MNESLTTFVSAGAIGIVILLLAVVLFSRIMNRRNQQSQARADFASYMNRVFEWSQNRSDLALTANAMEAIDDHRAHLADWQMARKHKFRLARARRDYLSEYIRLQRRHNEMLKAHNKNKSDETLSLAATCQEAVVSLTGGARMRPTDS
ncbi:MAG: hypothetical protein ACRBC3_23400 [Burkholderiaceae bacterium]